MFDRVFLRRGFHLGELCSFPILNAVVNRKHPVLRLTVLGRHQMFQIL